MLHGLCIGQGLCFMQNIRNKFILSLLLITAVGCWMLPVDVIAQGSPRELREMAN